MNKIEKTKAIPNEYESKVIDAVLQHIMSVTKKSVITYTERRLNSDGKFSCTGNSLKWLWTEGELKEVDLDFEPEESFDDFVFSHVYYGFSFSDTKMKLSFQAGPLFGRGFSYDYHLDENGKLILENRHTIWVS